MEGVELDIRRSWSLFEVVWRLTALWSFLMEKWWDLALKLAVDFSCVEGFSTVPTDGDSWASKPRALLTVVRCLGWGGEFNCFKLFWPDSRLDYFYFAMRRTFGLFDLLCSRLVSIRRALSVDDAALFLPVLCRLLLLFSPLIWSRSAI